MLLGGNYSPGHWPITEIGYQHVGEVTQVGEDVEGFSVGDLVYSDTPHRELNAAEVGADANTILIPQGIEPRDAALFGVASVAMHTVRRADLLEGEKSLVVGAGLIGQFTAQLAAACGSEVWICDLNAERLAIAASLGAKSIELTPEAGSWATVREAGPFDVVFEDSGAPVLDRIFGRGFPGQSSPSGPPEAGVTRHVNRRPPRVVMVAGRDRVSYDFNAAQLHEISVLHTGHFDLSDLLEVARLTASGGLRIDPLVSDEISIEEAPQLYSRLVRDPGSLLGTVFAWNGSPH